MPRQYLSCESLISPAALVCAASPYVERRRPQLLRHFDDLSREDQTLNLYATPTRARCQCSGSRPDVMPLSSDAMTGRGATTGSTRSVSPSTWRTMICSP